MGKGQRDRVGIVWTVMGQLMDDSVMCKIFSNPHLFSKSESDIFKMWNQH